MERVLQKDAKGTQADVVLLERRTSSALYTVELQIPQQVFVQPRPKYR